MDNKPFLLINFLDLTEDKIPEIKKFTKSSYNSEQILNNAEILKYAYPFAVIFGLVAKLTNITLSFMFDKKIEM